MSKRKFHMKQADLSGRNWRELSFRSFIEDGDAPRSLDDPIITAVCGEEIDYGTLFAYCFRRFGYPNRGWDDYKQLVRYYLNTPHPGLVLNVTPYVGNNAALSLQFIADTDINAAVDAYARRDRDAWYSRSLDWAEAQGLPEWMAEWVTIYNTEYREAFPHVPLAENWRDTITFPFALGPEGSRPFELTSRIVAFRKNLHTDYCQVEAWPSYYMRPVDVETWNEDDPLKPLAFAAIKALKDLRTPVGVRDQAIDAFGLSEDARTEAKPASSAGFPSGSLGNSAAEEFGKLHTLILELGKGNPKRGIQKALEAIELTRKPFRRTKTTQSSRTKSPS